MTDRGFVAGVLAEDRRQQERREQTDRISRSAVGRERSREWARRVGFPESVVPWAGLAAENLRAAGFAVDRRVVGEHLRARHAHLAESVFLWETTINERGGK